MTTTNSLSNPVTAALRELGGAIRNLERENRSLRLELQATRRNLVSVVDNLGADEADLDGSAQLLGAVGEKLTERLRDLLREERAKSRELERQVNRAVELVEHVCTIGDSEAAFAASAAICPSCSTILVRTEDGYCRACGD